MPISVLLLGAFGQRNPGDEALLTAFLAALDGFQVTVASSDPVHTRAMHGCRAIQGSAAATGRAVLEADAVVFGGGTVFKVLSASTGRSSRALLRNALVLATTAKALGKPVAVVGVGAAPLPDRRSAAMAVGIVRASDLLVLRDRESAAILNGAGAPVPLRVGADPVWTLLGTPGATGPDAASPSTPTEPTPASRDLVVALSTHAAPDPAGGGLADVVADVVRRVPAIDLVRLQPWQVGHRGYDDLDLARDVARRLTDVAPLVVVEAPPESVHSASHGMRSATVVLALRMHALVAAGAALRPVVAVGHEPKLAALAGRLGQPVVAIDDGADRIVAALQRARSTGGVRPADVQAEVQSATAMMRLLRLVLTGGQEAADIGGLRLEPVGVVR